MTKVGCAIVGFVWTCQQRAGWRRRRRIEFVGGGNGEPCGVAIVSPAPGEEEEEARAAAAKPSPDVPAEGWASEEEEDGFHQRRKWRSLAAVPLSTPRPERRRRELGRRRQ